ncbi:MAG: hypothetical protein QF797_02895 [Alphaproteobacteria bacterium]|jgi:2,4-dienoyl-CoA reductase-like NADH-dependent reductase (Old Yellow Enzyme family)|nr:hypothetical protein [Alphaproteobacteria bacterium]MDP6623863.1 hypothetical protein [Alphaproteobacteria bacterium]
MGTAGAERYPHLFSPLRLGPLELQNRFVVPALTTNFGDLDGQVTDEVCGYLGRRGAGGFGLVVCENFGVQAGAKAMPRMLMAHEDRYIPGMAKLAAAVKQAGAPVLAQLNHPGRQTKSKFTGHELVAPSAIPCPINREMPRALSRDEIPEWEEYYVRAAERAAEAGFDGVEVHGAHGYLVAGFLSSYANTREDDYGGSLENRCRFLLNIVDGIRNRMGPDFPLSVRISAREFVPDGIDVAEAIEIGRAVAAHGANALSVSVGVYQTFNKLSMVTGEPEGQWLDLAGEVRAGIPIPVMGVGRLVRAQVAEQGLAAGQIDLACFGRASMADPELPVKIRTRREAEVLTCMGCNICLGRSARPESICPVNPTIGREAEFDFAATASAQTVAVVGASFSALTAAWVAAKCGHKVTLHGNGAQGGALGGLMALRAKVPGNAVIGETAAALLGRAQAAGVQLSEQLPEAADVVWAVREFRPLDAAGPEGAISATAVFEGDQAGEALVVGDDLCAAEAAVVLAQRGGQVTLLSPARDIANDSHPGFREVCRRRLDAAGANIEVKVAEPFAHAAREQADFVVLGRGAVADWDDAGNWRLPEVGLPVSAYLDDAYEPGLLTRTVYEAVALARAL